MVSTSVLKRAVRQFYLKHRPWNPYLPEPEDVCTVTVEFPEGTGYSNYNVSPHTSGNIIRMCIDGTERGCS